ncbi:hypothetical protein C0Q70_17989 [Pomacea canaliculata]|uniref:SRCR domain-containing protein n=1 Tax=Pomacea canaliculata TaxID=400727 RepID=A0A2T7NLZ1_POMCA|nr:hypothetical protein C0Q70_17989 [Pomacea canaliculata]
MRNLTLKDLLFAVSLALVLSFCTAGPECFQCSDVTDPATCLTLHTCADDEVCESGDRFTFVHLVGKKRSVQSSLAVDRSRRDITVCSMCCRSSHCNKNICIGAPRETIPSAQEVYVRLFGGDSAYEGTVEVYHNGVWGSICDDNWNDMDAKVVCKMLGYTSQGAVGVQGGTYPESSWRIWLDEVDCDGTEAHLGQCHKNIYGDNDCSHLEDAGVICSSGEHLVNRVCKGSPFSRPTHLLPLTTTPNTDGFTFVDNNLNQIVSTRFDGKDLKLVMQLGANAEMDKIKVDPLNRKLFYSDRENDVIAMMNLDGSNFTVIANTMLEEPRDIALDPRNQKIYWTDWGSIPKIEVANYDGSGRTVLISSVLKWPNGIAIDYQDNAIFFADAGTHKIESMGLHGEDRTEVFVDNDAHFFALSIFEDFIYFADWNKNTVMRVKKDGTEKTKVGPPSFLQLKDIRIYSSKANLPGVTPAKPVELDRDHVFVRLSSDRGQTATSGFVEVARAVATRDAESGKGHGIISMSYVNCQGTEHHLLDCGITKDNWASHACSHDEDAGVMCTVDNTVNDFLLFTDSTTGINRMDLKTHSYVSLKMMDVTKPVALTFNPVDRRLYFSNMHDIPDSQIYSSKLDATGQKLVKHFPRDSEIDGLAVDGHMEKLFYTDAGRKIIASCNLDGSNETVIVDNLLDKPRAIVLDTDNRSLMRINKDGSEQMPAQQQQKQRRRQQQQQQQHHSPTDDRAI